MRRSKSPFTAALLLLFPVLTLPTMLKAQEGFFSPEQVTKYTQDWKGERFPDGRPKVPDSILDRMKNVTLEEGLGDTARRQL